MILKAKALVVTPLFLVVLIACQLPVATAPTLPPRPVINSRWTGSPPSIDGVFTAGEWSNPQIFLTTPDYPIAAYVYFLNDNSNLYVLVDAIGDMTDDANDECLLVFGFKSELPYFQVLVRIEGQDGEQVSNDFEGAIGFDVSPNSPSPPPHKIYEFSIPFSYINAEPGQPIDFCSPAIGIKGASMPYDAGSEPTRDNVWPYYLNIGNIGTWGIFNQGQPRPVGGVLTPTNKLEVLAPYLALIGLVGAVTVVVAMRRRLGA